MLEIGAGKGEASLEALQKGAIAWVNDLDSRHLSHFSEDVPHKVANNYKLIIGDFPDNLDLPKAYFDAILAVRVLHFFDPPKLERAIIKFYDSLKPKGKVFILATTPYLKDWKSFISVYERRKKKGELYPGYVENLSRYNPQFKGRIPEKMHFLDPIVLRREFEKAGFIVRYSDFIQQKNIITQTNKNFSLVGVVAQKP